MKEKSWKGCLSQGSYILIFKGNCFFVASLSVREKIFRQMVNTMLPFFWLFFFSLLLCFLKSSSKDFYRAKLSFTFPVQEDILWLSVFIEGVFQLIFMLP